MGEGRAQTPHRRLFQYARHKVSTLLLVSGRGTLFFLCSVDFDVCVERNEALGQDNCAIGIKSLLKAL